MRKLMPAIAVLLLGLFLYGCPGKDSGNSKSESSADAAKPAAKPAGQHDRRSQQAIDFLLASLREPAMADHASLEDCWSIISRLPDASPFAVEIEQQVARAGGQPGFELLSAWLATNPQAATEYVRSQCQSGNGAVLQALIRFPEIGRDILAGLDFTNQSVDFQDASLLLIRQWGDPHSSLLPVFEQLAESPEPDISLRAIGYLLRLDAASAEQLATLEQAVSTEKQHFMAAIEAAKISRSPELATAFIPRVKDAPLGEPDPTLGWDMEPYFSAYALAYIPGEDAEVIRQRLLGAANLDLRWQARFGELMQGDPTSFWEAALDEGILSPYVMKCLAPPEAVHPDLLPWYRKALEQSQEAQRFQLASQLSRYNEHAPDPGLRELVLGLLEDPSSLIRGQGWLLAAEFGYEGRRVEAAHLLASETEQAASKAAAACYLLSVGDGWRDTGS